MGTDREEELLVALAKSGASMEINGKRCSTAGLRRVALALRQGARLRVTVDEAETAKSLLGLHLGSAGTVQISVSSHAT
jgi:hypothetical protein